jgi:parallel beta helix pectate lyase-like protein/uncharacterized protein DUF1565
MAHFFVSNSGNDANPGSLSEPFGTIAKGTSVLKAGDVLNLRQGNYVESVTIKGLHGSQTHPIIIRSHPGEHATIDGCVTQFCEVHNKDWEPALLHDSIAHIDEFVSRDPLPLNSVKDLVNRGAFLDGEPYTRLITYSRLEDLRADNQTFDRVSLNNLVGPQVTDEDGNGKEFRRPWVYMGPGLFFKPNINNSIEGRVHIRLSHTSNNIQGLADYKGETDPENLRLAISHSDTTTLVVENAKFIQFENLSIRFGGEKTLHIKNTDSVVFDHVRILAASTGAAFEQNTRTVFRHCEINGGLPSWYFRSDRKGGYNFKENDIVVFNSLGEKTSIALIDGGLNNTGIEMHNCEFLNGHDLYLFGRDVRFHHNWINNLNDEGLFLDKVETRNLHIFQNAITQCLSAISFGGIKLSDKTHIYRNLIDLRRPTAGNRPRFQGDQDVFRFGQLYKSGNKAVDGALDLFQNTCLVLRQDVQASYLHYRETGGTRPRRSFNNIFVAVNPNPESDLSMTFLPPPSFPGPTDGNCYFRIGGHAEKPLLRYLKYEFQDEPFPGRTFADLEALRGNLKENPPASEFFKQSKTQYEPGYEASSIEADPKFRRIGGDGTSPFNSDDFRLQTQSPAKGAGIVLPEDLRVMDTLAPPAPGRPDIGCYQVGKPGLHVGVDGRRHFPLITPGEIFEDPT